MRTWWGRGTLPSCGGITAEGASRSTWLHAQTPDDILFFGGERRMDPYTCFLVAAGYLLYW